MITPGVYFWLCLKASLFSTGGMGNLPSLHDDFLLRGWANDRQFVESLAVGQVAPGPNGLWVISLGYLTYGLRGALLTLLALVLPPLLVLVVDRLYQRAGRRPVIEGFVHGISMAVIGIFVVVLLNILRSAGIDLRGVFITLAAIALGRSRSIPVVAILALGGVVGVVSRMGGW